MGRDGLVSDAKQQRLYEYVKRGSGVEPQGGRCPTAGTGIAVRVRGEVMGRTGDVRAAVVFGGVAATLALVGFAASFIPARRVARVNPVVALNAE